MDDNAWRLTIPPSSLTREIACKIPPAVAILQCSIAALNGPEFLSRERRAEIAEQLRATVAFIETIGGYLT